MNISYVKFNSKDPRLLVKLSQTLEGEEWSRIVSVNGDEAKKIWDSWGTKNEDEIIEQIIAKAN